MASEPDPPAAAPAAPPPTPQADDLAQMQRKEEQELARERLKLERFRTYSLLALAFAALAAATLVALLKIPDADSGASVATTAAPASAEDLVARAAAARYLEQAQAQGKRGVSSEELGAALQSLVGAGLISPEARAEAIRVALDGGKEIAVDVAGKAADRLLGSGKAEGRSEGGVVVNCSAPAPPSCPPAPCAGQPGGPGGTSTPATANGGGRRKSAAACPA